MSSSDENSGSMRSATYYASPPTRRRLEYAAPVLILSDGSERSTPTPISISSQENTTHERPGPIIEEISSEDDMPPLRESSDEEENANNDDSTTSNSTETSNDASTNQSDDESQGEPSVDDNATSMHSANEGCDEAVDPTVNNAEVVMPLIADAAVV